MDVVEAIRTRRMLPKVRDERPSRAQIEALLELAVRAPTHHRTQPWRFHVLAGSALDDLARAIADEQVDSAAADPDAALVQARKKVSRAPVIAVVTALPSDAPEVVEQEEIAATAMAIQNVLLAAHVEGIGVMLRTGPVAYHPAITKRLDLDPREKVVGMLYIGYPAGDRALTERAPATEKTRWLGWEDT